MTELAFLLATDVARIMAASAILREVMPSERVPEAEYQQVLRTLFRWQQVTFEAIHASTDKTADAPEAPTEADKQWAREIAREVLPPTATWRPRTCTKGGLCLCDCHEAKETP